MTMELTLTRVCRWESVPFIYTTMTMELYLHTFTNYIYTLSRVATLIAHPCTISTHFHELYLHTFTNYIYTLSRVATLISHTCTISTHFLWSHFHRPCWRWLSTLESITSPCRYLSCRSLHNRYLHDDGTDSHEHLHTFSRVVLKRSMSHKYQWIVSYIRNAWFRHT